VLFLQFLLAGFLMAQQVSIPRIDLMPAQPAPYAMRNWRSVARGYDSLVFNPALTGQYLPLVNFYAQGTNYPQQGFFGLNTVVGTTRPSSTEAINALPAIVGATLAGADKRNQFGYDFVLMAQDYFNKRASENIYLNAPVTQSGNDWWYETMPNVYFYQMNALYPHTGDFDAQVITVANRWLQTVQAMGGSTTPWSVPYMNYRAWKFSTMTPLTTGVIEPEAAGAIAWILYNAYKLTGSQAYRIGAEQALEFLNGLSTNPAYELQLSYGVNAAARMNAEVGTTYEIDKMLDWCFEIGPLRTWGSMLGTWGGYDVSGLIGENNSNGYAFIMNGFQQAGALLPLLRYDERFANALGKWALNLANASRLFYPNYLPDANQDGRDWSKQYDPQSYIAHEALRQSVNGNTPFATGDAVSGSWGQTNLSLYSSSSVGYLGGMLDTTDVPQILRFDLLKNDFYHDTAYPTYLYYNPYQSDKTITLNLPQGTFSLYDAVTNAFMKTNVAGVVQISLPASTSRIVVLTPANGTVTYAGTKMLVNGIIVDYHSGQAQGNLAPRIKSLSPVNSTLPQGSTTTMYCTAISPNSDTLSYVWSVNGGGISGSGSVVTFQAPAASGSVTVQCVVHDQHGNSTTANCVLTIVDRINHAPVLSFVKASPQKITINAPVQLTAQAADADLDSLVYTWRTPDNQVIGTGTAIGWTSPASVGNYYLKCTVTDGYGGTATDSVLLIVRDFANYQTGNIVAYYSFSGNANDESGNGNNAFVYQATLTSDRFGKPASAYLFDGTSSYIQVHNTTALNFQTGLTLNFWMKPNYLYATREQYPISHGNWEHRWKVSMSNTSLRWTVKTNAGVHDLDAKTKIAKDSLYNVTALYDGSTMEVYINGLLDAAYPWSGSILPTDIDLIIGQVLPGNTQYGFSGVIDDVRLYNYALLPDAIKQFYDMPSAIKDEGSRLLPKDFSVRSFPNPCNGQLTISVQSPVNGSGTVTLNDVLGREVSTIYNGTLHAGEQQIRFNLGSLSSGIYFVLLKNEHRIFTNKVIIIK
jgi:hypothetical protein